MLDLFEKKQRNDFSDKIRKVFNLLTISRKYRIVGSAGYKNLLYVADYDLNELYKKRLDNKSALDLIYNMFKSKFQKALKDPNCIITDFKCGLNTNGDPLRWDKNDMKNGYKILADGRKIAFQDCILQKAPMKLDVVEIIEDAIEHVALIVEDRAGVIHEHFNATRTTILLSEVHFII